MREDAIKCYKVAIAFTVIMLIGIVGLFVIELSVVHNKSELISKIESNADNVTVYLDGIEIPIETINLKDYKITYDEINNIVKLTKPVYSSYRINPTIVPVIH